jgi:cell wall-active antibiotic response 4TMS protein YvqF/B-box zinc finger protein
MNCANHPDVSAAAFCRECGKPMCQECQRPALGSIYCAEHLPAAAAPPPIPTHAAPSPYTSSPYTAPVFDHPPADPSVHPVLALILGFLPGVGAIYNGQYAKGLIHAVIFGLLVSIAGNVHRTGFAGFIGIMIGVWVIYQAFEAYHTARKRRYGIAVEEFSSLFEIRPAHGRFPVGAIALIGVGFILLLDNIGIIRLWQFERYWPALLIVAGLYLLYARLSSVERHSGSVKGEAPR